MTAPAEQARGSRADCSLTAVFQMWRQWLSVVAIVDHIFAWKWCVRRSAKGEGGVNEWEKA